LKFSKFKNNIDKVYKVTLSVYAVSETMKQIKKVIPKIWGNIKSLFKKTKQEKK